MDEIVIRGARQHNLKNLNIDIPRNKLVVITGLSGSGKSTLAFDTLYAEGQRRYVESLSTYARQFLERMEKPDVDIIEGLSPAIAIEQKSAGQNPRSTVGTVTEIYDYFRLLFARIGIPHCHQCGSAIQRRSLDQLMDRIMDLGENTRVLVIAPILYQQKGDHEMLLKKLRREGFARLRVDGVIRDIETLLKLDKRKPHDIEVVIDRLVIKPTIKNRLADSLELALGQSGGTAKVDVLGRETGEISETILFSEKAVCARCNISYPEFNPSSFSFNSPGGACPNCKGLGSVSQFDMDLIVPDPRLSLREGGIAPWAHRKSVNYYEFMESLASHYQADIFTPFEKLPEPLKKTLFFGSGSEVITFYFERNGKRNYYQKPFEGIIPVLDRRYLESTSHSAREDIRKFMNFTRCPECAGERLNQASRNVRIQGMTIGEMTKLTIAQASIRLKSLGLEPKETQIAARILNEIHHRLEFLENVGLPYLTLDRPANTLSGGENQRIRLATQIGAKLSGILYVLDEPSVGLHQKDNQKLLAALKQMRDLTNTVLVVEHDEDTIRASDFVIDMGPGAGIHGGEIVFKGTPEALLESESSLTGQYLSGRKRIEVPKHRRQASGNKLSILKAGQNNLKDLNVDFPLGCFTCVTGVSGSGKSSLVIETLYHALEQRLHGARTVPGLHEKLLGHEYIDNVVNMDQSAIGKTPRSNPGTYIGVFAFIRELFSKTPEARMRGYGPGRFSFNVKGGRCEACEGEGIVKIEMHFLPDVYVPCDVCGGKRYNRETLEIRYKGKNIADVLEMTVSHAVDFFGNIEKIRSKLETLMNVGLGYLPIGQAATTLSGGEAQRVKLSRELSKRETGKTVYILDEPTTGLHMEDIKKLLSVLDRLVDNGNTVIVIEHHLDVIKTADHVIDLGPEGGDEGGYLVASGTPEEIAENPLSHTGRFLRKVLYQK
jgi:excinuclease ABC subunit A